MSRTERAYGAFFRRRRSSLVRHSPMLLGARLLRACYAMSRTGLAYAAARYRSSVLRHEPY
eukprot:1445739-Rhodomonas_salina.1